MDACKNCQPNLLPYLYDLLDEGEAQSLREHLESCADCARALDAARQHKAMLAEALRESFPQVSFAPPSVKEPVAPQLLPMPARPQRGLARWSAAASLLAAAIGLGGYFAYAGWSAREGAVADAETRYADAGKKATDLDAAIRKEQERIQNEIREVNSQVDELLGTWRAEAEKTKRVFEQNDTKVVIESPGSLQAGAKNEITIDVKNKGGGGPKALRAQIVNPETKAVLYTTKFDPRKVQKITLPSDLPLTPKTKLALVVDGEDEKGHVLHVVDHLALVVSEYVTHLYLDRPMYRPGETVRFRSLTLERYSLKPAQETMHLRFSVISPKGGKIFEVEKPSLVVDGKTGEPIVGPDGAPVRGLAVAEFHIPPFLEDGPYHLEVAEVKNRFPAQKRKFHVQRWEPPRLVKELKFDKSSYGPGERVLVHGSAVAVESGKAVPLTAVLQRSIDDLALPAIPVAVDAKGHYRAEFILPPALKRGDAMVSVIFTGEGFREPVERTLPIVLNRLLVHFYPEGGNLIVGLPNRVYFQAHTPLGKPADLEGSIVDGKGNVVVRVKTLTDEAEPGINQGMGSFVFTPKVGERYTLRVDMPKKLETNTFDVQGDEGKVALRDDGVVLNLPRGVVEQDIPVVLYSTQDRELLVGAYCRGKLLDNVPVHARKGEKTEVQLKSPPGIAGVYRITVFEKAGDRKYIPLAERLIYSKGSDRLTITLASPGKALAPREHVDLELSVKNEKKEFAPSILMVSAVELGLVKLADDRTIHRMPSHFLLTSEVRRPEDLENVDVLLGNHAKAEQALDLLLGVQGWRRFAEQNPARFHEKDHLAALRVLPGMTPGARKTIEPEIFEIEKIGERHALKYVELQKGLAQRERSLEKEQDRQGEVNMAKGMVDESAWRLGLAQQRLHVFETIVRRAALGVLFLGLLLGGLLMIRWGVGRLSRGEKAAPWFFAGGIVLALLLLGSLGGIHYYIENVEFGELHAYQAGAKPAPAQAPAAGAMPMASPAPEAKVEAAPPVRPEGPPPPSADAVKLAPPKSAPSDEPKEIHPGGGGPAAKGAFSAKKGAPTSVPVPGMGGGFGGGGVDPFPPRPVTVHPPAPVTPVSPPGPPAALGTPMAEAGAWPGAVPPPVDTTSKTPAPKVRGPKGDVAAGAEGGKGERIMPGGGGGPPRIDDERELRRRGMYKELLERHAFREIILPDLLEPSVVREYAHKHVAAPDHAELLLWQPVLVSRDGRVNVGFDLSDLVTTYQVTVFAHTVDGRLGASTFELRVSGKAE